MPEAIIEGSHILHPTAFSIETATTDDDFPVVFVAFQGCFEQREDAVELAIALGPQTAVMIARQILAKTATAGF